MHVVCHSSAELGRIGFRLRQLDHLDKFSWFQRFCVICGCCFRRAVAQLSGKRRGESWSLAGSSAFVPVRCGKNIVAGLFQDWVVVYVRLSILLWGKIHIKISGISMDVCGMAWNKYSLAVQTSPPAENRTWTWLWKDFGSFYHVVSTGGNRGHAHLYVHGTHVPNADCRSGS